MRTGTAREQRETMVSSAAKDLWLVVKKTVNEWIDDDVPTHAASLAYYTIFSIAPTLIIASRLRASSSETKTRAEKSTTRSKGWWVSRAQR